MTADRRERLEKAISDYEEGVDQALCKLRKDRNREIVFLLMPILFAAVAYIWVGVGGLVTNLGLGGVNAADKLSRGETVLRTYGSECFRLKISLLKLKSELNFCNPNDETCLKEVERLIREYMDRLERPY